MYYGLGQFHPGTWKAWYGEPPFRSVLTGSSQAYLFRNVTGFLTMDSHFPSAFLVIGSTKY